jgi:aspartate-semialdehyde dehydrogenase
MNPNPHPISVGILGATGAVGQKFVELLDRHPWFTITALAASARSAGKTYAEAVNWISSSPIPPSIAGMEVLEAAPGLPCDVVFSGLDAAVAGDLEKAFAEAGYAVISNAKNYRMHEQVPLLIPEVNPDHTALIDHQPWRDRGGFIVTNPNCATVGLVGALRPIEDAFGIEAIQVTTMQAVSGAGYPGVASLDILGNVIPYIGGEEEKMAIEPLKLLGRREGDRIVPASMRISAQCNRVPVLDGHLECVSLKLRSKASVADVLAALRGFETPAAVQGLPSAPEAFLRVFDEMNYPQPRRHAHLGRGMTIAVGRVRACEVLDVKLVVLSHNTVRGAAGGAVLNAELLIQQGYLQAAEARRMALA